MQPNAPKLRSLPQLADSSEAMPNSRKAAPMLTLYVQQDEPNERGMYCVSVRT